jgi:hypothetical protein
MNQSIMINAFLEPQRLCLFYDVIIRNSLGLFSFTLRFLFLELDQIECSFVSSFSRRPLLQPDFHIYNNNLELKK